MGQALRGSGRFVTSNGFLLGSNREGTTAFGYSAVTRYTVPVPCAAMKRLPASSSPKAEIWYVVSVNREFSHTEPVLLSPQILV